VLVESDLINYFELTPLGTTDLVDFRDNLAKTSKTYTSPHFDGVLHNLVTIKDINPDSNFDTYFIPMIQNYLYKYDVRSISKKYGDVSKLLDRSPYLQI